MRKIAPSFLSLFHANMCSVRCITVEIACRVLISASIIEHSNAARLRIPPRFWPAAAVDCSLALPVCASGYGDSRRTADVASCVTEPSSRADEICCVPKHFHQRHGGSGLGQHQFRGISLPGHTLVWSDKIGRLHETIRGPEEGISSCIPSSLQIVFCLIVLTRLLKCRKPGFFRGLTT